MGKLFEDIKPLSLDINAKPSTLRESQPFGKIELKYGSSQSSPLDRGQLQRSMRDWKLEYGTGLPATTIKFDTKIKLDVNGSGASQNGTPDSTSKVSPNFEQQRKDLETQLNLLRPKSWDEFIRTWGTKSIEEYKKAITDYNAKLLDFSKNACESAAKGLELRIPENELNFKARLMQAAKRDGVENAVIARRLLACSETDANKEIAKIAASERIKVRQIFNALDPVGDATSHRIAAQLKQGATVTKSDASPEIEDSGTPKIKKKFIAPKVEVTVMPAKAKAKK